MHHFIKKPLVIAVVTGLASLSTAAFSACNNSGDPIQVNASCDDLIISNTKSGVTISQSTTVSAFFRHTMPY
jgi:hypothetical protein